MKTSYAISLILAMVAVATVSILPCSAAEKDEENIWREEEPRGPRRGPRRFELTDERIEGIMKSLAEKDPAKAKKLRELRQKDPEAFKAEIGKIGREQFGKWIRERMEMRGRKRHAEFVEWLQKNYPQEAEKLAKLKEKEPDPKLYIGAFDRSVRQYGRIFEAARENPELAEVLKEDLRLRKKRDELLRKISTASDDDKKKKLVEYLKEVVSNRFDLIVRQKQIAYEHLRKRLEELKKRVRESQVEVDRLMDVEFKNENVKARLEELMSRPERLRWD